MSKQKCRGCYQCSYPMHNGLSGMKPFQVKIVLVGDGGVGKSALIQRYVQNDIQYIPSACDNYSNSTTMQNNENNFKVNYSIWDTVGAEDYDCLRPLSYVQATMVLYCFSICSPKSLENIHSKWIPELRHHLGDSPRKNHYHLAFLIGNKFDLINERTKDIQFYRLVSCRFVKKYIHINNFPNDIIFMIAKYNFDKNKVKKYNFIEQDTIKKTMKTFNGNMKRYFEVSAALNGTDVDEMFESAIQTSAKHLLNKFYKRHPHLKPKQACILL